MSDLLQIIDGNSDIHPNLQNEIPKWLAPSQGFNYKIVAILGCQSSGKSTLLNMLFGTGFQVMDEAQGRHQTTLGVWLGKSHDSTTHGEDVLVMDVEGTDSRERGEEHKAFERKTSLFSLALAEVLMINLWASDIGRWDAANYSLLKNVFELNLQLFQRAKKNKTLLFFIIRDHFYDAKRKTGTPIELLTPTIQRDLEKIWSEIIKPDDFKSTQVTDFFDFNFTALPHKLHAPDDFEEKVAILKKRFSQAEQDDYILDKKYKSDVPSDALPAFIGRLWTTIKENKDLDLPAEKVMVAVFRCTQISEALMAKFNEDLGYLRKILKQENREAPDFAPFSSKLMNDAVASFDEQSHFYDPEVSSQKRAGLNEQMRKELRDLFSIQIKFITNSTIAKFKEAFTKALPTDGRAVRNFCELSKSVLETALEDFESRSSKSIPENTDWDLSLERTTLREQLDEYLSVQRKKQMELMTKEVEGFLKKNIYNPLSQHLDKAGPTMWDDLTKLYQETHVKTGEQLKELLAGFQCSEEEVFERIASLKSTVFSQFRDLFREKVKGNLASKMLAKFNDHFKYDSSGIPRKWKPDDEIPPVFKQAREKGTVLIEMFSVLRLKPELRSVSVFDPSATIDPEYIILSAEECNQQIEIYKRDCDAAYSQAVYEQEHAGSKAMMGPLMMGLVAILGWNEAMMVLSWALWNPIFFLLFLIIGIVLYVGYALDMLGVYGNIARHVLHTMYTEGVKFANEKLNQHQLAGAPKPKTD